MILRAIGWPMIFVAKTSCFSNLGAEALYGKGRKSEICKHSNEVTFDAHLWLLSNFLGSLTLLICPKGWKRALISLAVASKATLRTTILVLRECASFLLPPVDADLRATPFFMLSCRESLWPSSIEPCRQSLMRFKEREDALELGVYRL